MIERKRVLNLSKYETRDVRHDSDNEDSFYRLITNIYDLSCFSGHLYHLRSHDSMMYDHRKREQNHPTEKIPEVIGS